MNMTKAPIRLWGGILFAWVLLAQTAWAQESPIRIVVVPFYTEGGTLATEAGRDALHYRRVSRYINNQLKRHGFDVINLFAHVARESEYNRLHQRAMEDSVLAARELTRQFLVDAVYLLWLDVETYVTSDGYCKAEATVGGEGYDSAAGDLGAGLDRIFTMSRRQCKHAIVEVEKLAGDAVGRILTAWKGSRIPQVVVDPGGDAKSGGGGVIEESVKKTASLIDVRLEGATHYALVEVFGKVINTARGVVEATAYGVVIQPGNPQASYANWRVRIQNTEITRLSANVQKMFKKIYQSGGRIVVNGVTYAYTPAEVDLLKAIRPGNSAPRSIVFVVDRDRAQNLEFSSGYD